MSFGTLGGRNVLMVLDTQLVPDVKLLFECFHDRNQLSELIVSYIACSAAGVVCSFLLHGKV